MFPGRFPSPTPSLSDSESSASELKNEGFRSSLNTKRRRNISFDYTAPSSLRMKPEFAQSGPSLASTSGVHTPSRPTEAPRSASDPLLNRQRSCLQSNGSPIRITKNRHQKRTNGSAREPTTRRASHQRSTSPKDIYTNTRSPNPETPTRSATSSVQQSPERAPPEAKQPSPNPQGSNSPRSPETTRSVQDKLQSKLSKTVKPNTSKGYVYVIRDPKRPELGYKIGSTGGDPTTRLKQYKTKCGFVPQLINDPFEVEYFQHTEILAHADLAYWCRPYACQCGTLHHEWFAVSEEVAVQTAERWVGFMRRERPYDYKGRLRCVWSYLLERRRVSCGASEASDHDARWEKWARVLESPSVGDYWHATIDSLSSDLRKVRFKIYTVWTFTTTFLWQLSTFIYALVTIFHFQSVLVLTVSMVLGVCAFCSMLKVHIPISTKRRSQRE